MSRLQFISLCFISGVAIGAVGSASVCIVVTILLLLGCTVSMVLDNRHNGALPFALLATISGLCLQHPFAPPSTASQINIDRPCQRIMEGIVNAPPIHTPHRTRLSVDISAVSQCIVEKQPPVLLGTQDKAYISIRNIRANMLKTQRNSKVCKGDRIRLSAHVQPKRAYHKDFAVSTAMTRYLTAAVATEDQIAVINRNNNPVENWLQKRRDATGELFFDTMSDENARLAIALTTGQRRVLPETLTSDFRNIGTVHLLVVSGLHLGIIAVLTWHILLFILRRMPAIAQRFNIFRACSFLTIPVVIIFVLFSGANPPAVRACVMTLSVLLALQVYRQSNGFQSLTLAAALLLSYTPELIGNAGFQLSFVCVFAFLVFRPKPASIDLTDNKNSERKTQPQNEPQISLQRLWHRIFAEAKGRIHMLFRVSVIAFAATAPVLTWHFHQIPWIAPLANMIMVPLVSILILPLLVLSLLIGSLVANWALPLIKVAEALLTILKSVARSLSLIGSELPVNDWYSMIMILAATLTILLAVKQKYRLCALAGSVCLASFIAATVINGTEHRDNRLTIDFLDVGQGDATLLTFPDNSHWLIDAGGTASHQIGSGHIVPILQKLRVRSLNRIVLTHPDPDHVAGIPDVLRAIATDEIVENKQGRDESTPPTYNEMLQLAKQQGVRVIPGTKLCTEKNIHGVTIQVIHPCDPKLTYFPWLSFNDNSIVLQLSYGERRVLLTGDLSLAGEQHLLNTVQLKRADLLKLGHHGSSGATSEPFLNRIAPKFAIASCGYHNRYGFPAESLKKRLRQHRVMLLETGQNGWIRAEISRKDIRIIPQKSPPSQHF